MDAIANTVTNEAPDTANDWLAAHGDYLFNLAVGQVRDPVVAEDLVQETFLAALRARDRFAGRSSDRTWLVGILRHKIYDHLRRLCRERPVYADSQTARSGHEAWDDSVLWAHEVAGECLEPSRRMELAELREALEMALGRLPSRIAQVFQLYEIEERPNREVCEQLKISASNLWVTLHRARKQLRDELAGWWAGRSRKSEIRDPKSETEPNGSDAPATVPQTIGGSAPLN
ncbi:MAG TPA: sigma-70 family RNA polymerase sigma factor [Verrucomicrobiae bacterium]